MWFVYKSIWIWRSCRLNGVIQNQSKTNCKVRKDLSNLEVILYKLRNWSKDSVVGTWELVKSSEAGNILCSSFICLSFLLFVVLEALFLDIFK